MNTKKIERGIRLVLEGLDVDLEDRNFAGTPKRVARMYREMLTPKRRSITTFPEKYNNMVVLRGHTIFGICPHHLLPVEMRVHIGYIPNQKVLGLSKLARIAEAQLTTPIMQETLTDLICLKLNEYTDAAGASVIITGKHGCMKYRGVHTQADVVTSARRGVFLANPSTQNEFMQIVGKEL